MQSRAKLLGHPVHPMLIVFPLGLLATAVAFDIVGLVLGDNSWFGISYWMIAAGITGGLLAAVFGLIDWIGIPSGTRAKRIGLLHGGINVIVVVAFLIACLTRRAAGDVTPSSGIFTLEVIALLLGSVGGWLGGELVDRLGVGVADGAHV